MEEPTSIAVADSPATAPVVVEAPSSPAVIPPSEPYRETAVTSKHFPFVNGKISEQEVDRLASLVETPAEYQPITAPENDPEPAKLTSDNRISDAWLNWLTRNLPGEGADKDEPAPAELAEFGLTLPEIKTTLTVVGELFTEPDGAVNALNSLDDATYTKIANTCIAADPAYTVRSLQGLGHLPAGEAPNYDLPQDLQRAIPLDLQATAKTIETKTLYEWGDQGIDALIENLEQERDNLDRWQEADDRWYQAIEQAQADGQNNLQALVNMYVDEHSREFAKWKPTRDEKTNITLRNMVFASAINEMLSDPKWAGINQAMTVMLTDAPKWRLFGEFETANRYELDARNLARRSSVKLGQIIREHLKSLQTILKGVVEEEKPAEPPDPEPPKLTKDNKVSDTWMNWLARQTDKRAKGGVNATV